MNIEIKTISHKETDVYDFDVKFEKDRARKLHGPGDEPGDDPAAPYRLCHFWATTVERILAALIGVDWTRYDAKVMSL